MMRHFVYAAVLAGSTAMVCLPAGAQSLEPGAMAGGSYIPSTHTKGCGGVLCDSDDPRRAPGAAAPPPCQGLLCSMTPYAMGQPVTAATAPQAQSPRVETAPAEPVTPKRSVRRKKKTKTLAARTPAPAAKEAQ